MGNVKNEPVTLTAPVVAALELLIAARIEKIEETECFNAVVLEEMLVEHNMLLRARAELHGWAS